MGDCVTAVRRRETELLTQLRAAFAGDPAVQAFIADRPSIEATLHGLDNTCQLTDIIVGERSVELLLLKDDIAQRMTSLLQTSLAQPPPHMRSSYVRFIPASCDQPFPVGRLDLVDETVSLYDDKALSSPDVVDRGLRPQGDGHDAVSDGAADIDNLIQDGGLRPEVEIKRCKMDGDAEVEDEEEGLSGDVTTKPLITTSDHETMTWSCVKSGSKTMRRCVHVEDKLISTSSQLIADRSALTQRPPEPCHRATEADALPDSSSVKLTSHDTQTSASVFQMTSKYVETEPPPLVNKFTSTEQPFQMDKVRHL